MSYTPPTAADLKVRFPEFAPVSSALIQMILDDEAIPAVGETWLERDRRTAQLYLAAHLLASEGEPARTTSGGSSSGSNGPIKMMQAGEHKIEYAVSNESIAASFNGGYDTTVYGNRYLELLRLNFPPVLTV